MNPRVTFARFKQSARNWNANVRSSAWKCTTSAKHSRQSERVKCKRLKKNDSVSLRTWKMNDKGKYESRRKSAGYVPGSRNPFCRKPVRICAMSCADGWMADDLYMCIARIVGNARVGREEGESSPGA